MTGLSDTLFLFTSSATGLGHIRVMNAIYDARPSGITSVNIGIANIKASKIHEIGSRILPFIKLTEFYQTNPLAEYLVAGAYTLYLRRHVKGVIAQFEEIKKEYATQKKWVIISTHFALAHTISAAKEILEKKLNIKIYLCVVVTDDSPQRVWQVANSDLTFAPSAETAKKLGGNTKTVSFPLSPRLAQNLTPSEFEFIINQVDPTKSLPTQIEIPISGAAVQLPYLTKIIENLCRQNFEFTAIGQESILTAQFFEDISRLPHVQVSIGKDPWQTVEFYQSLFYQPKRPVIEITKPSEQAFKAILTPRQRGGVILFLTKPVGRQEYDNLNFLSRNGLLPNDEEQKEMLVSDNLKKWSEKALHWRALRLPDDAMKASIFIAKLKETGILYTMLSCIMPKKDELRDDGVKMIWDEIGKLLTP